MRINWRVASTVVVLATGVALGVAPDLFVGDEPECIDAAEWAAAHQANLPATKTEIAAFPVAYQREIFSRLTPEQKSDVWRDHLQTQLSNGTLSDAQRSLLQKISGMVSARLYEGSAPRPRPADLDAVLPEIEKVFPVESQRMGTFSALGSEHGAITAASWKAVARHRLRVYASVLALQDCNCSTSWGCSGSGQLCCCVGPGLLRCNETVGGCGPLWAYDCDGRCFGVETCPPE
jgi:hypothetical protein